MLFFPVSLLCWNDEIDYRDVSSVVGGGTEHGTTANVLKKGVKAAASTDLLLSSQGIS